MPAYICCRLHLLPSPNPLDTCLHLLTCTCHTFDSLCAANYWSLHPISDVIIRINSQIHAKLLWGSSWWWKDLQQFLFVVMVAACLLEKRQGFDYLASLGSFRLISICRLGFQFAAAVVDGHCTDLGNDQLVASSCLLTSSFVTACNPCSSHLTWQVENQIESQITNLIIRKADLSNLELLHFDGSSDFAYCSGMTLYSPHMSVQIVVENTQQLATSHHQTPPETSVGDFSWGGLWGRSGFMARSDRREASWQVWQCEWEAPWQLGDRATAVGWLAHCLPSLTSANWDNPPKNLQQPTGTKPRMLPQDPLR